MLAVIRVLFFFATLFAILPAFANPAVVLVEEFTITVDQPSLYRAWAKNDNAYKAANPWNVVWSKNCERLQMECTDQAYRKLPAGTKMHLPAPVIRAVALGDVSGKTMALTPTTEAKVFNLTFSDIVVAPVVVAPHDTNAVRFAQVKQADAEQRTEAVQIKLYATSAALVALLAFLAFVYFSKTKEIEALQFETGKLGEEKDYLIYCAKQNARAIAAVEISLSFVRGNPTPSRRLYLAVAGVGDSGQLLIHTPWRSETAELYEVIEDIKRTPGLVAHLTARPYRAKSDDPTAGKFGVLTHATRNWPLPKGASPGVVVLDDIVKPVFAEVSIAAP